MRRILLALVLFLGLLSLPTASLAAGDDILTRLQAVPGLTVTAEQPAPAPYRYFVLSYTQPVDHLRPWAGTFQQRFTLLHKDVSRPMVLHTTGYNLRVSPSRSEPAALIDGNQISVEQRFFTPSRPEPADWSTLTIWQAATDHHRIVTALKAIYPRKWISTGASKGGMTSVYHHRFYPNDVDGTVAYVAPNDAVNVEDSAYDKFFTTVGSTPACERSIEALQAEALHRRTELVTRYEAWAAANGRTFAINGTADRAFEFTVNGLNWAFWQYSRESDCGGVPATTASSDDLWAWIDDVYGLDSNTDQGITGFVPYYYQAGTQLGYPLVTLPYLDGLRRYPGQDVPRAYVPAELPLRFQPWAMLDVDLWVKLAGQRLLFVYGQNDPWGAEPFRTGPGSRDCYSYTVAGGNHGSNIGRLTPAESATAQATVRRWAGVTAATPLAAERIPALDDWNEALDRQYSR